MTRDDKLIALISDYGIANADACVISSHERERPTLARCLAQLENESAGRNIFGAEGSATPPEWYEGDVTQKRYDLYARRCDEGYTVNGVGPCQLTDRSLQLEADQLGGCWIPLHNMQVGQAFLHQLILEHGVRGGFTAYNGSGPAAENYANRALERAAIWEARLRAHGLD
jgi:hypothetical protein